MEDLVEVIFDALGATATCELSARKATSLAMRFLGNALDVVR
jgi:hypothetical protein